jgi:proline iminopeptidase
MQWEYLQIPLAERELTMVYLEPAGTGESGSLAADADYDVATYVSHLDAVVETFGGDPVFLLGHGHGGFVAQRYALRRPARVAGLILYATSPIADRRTLAATRERLVRYEASSPGLLAAWDRPLGADVDEATRRLRDIFPAYFADYQRRKAEFRPLRDQVRCWPRRAPEFDVCDELPSIAAPTLVIAGVQDIFWPEGGEVLQQGIPGSRLVTFPESGHLAHVEEAERFAHVLLEFTRRVSGPVRTARA